jgi:hypothetical protein
MSDPFTDLFGIGFPKSFQPYATDDGWMVVLPGEEDGRRGNKRLVAVTKVHIRLSNRRNLQKCIKHLEESDRRLRLLQTNPWDWQRVEVKDNEVRFGVAWYDRSFFEAKKFAWSDENHTGLYSQFGATKDDFTVEHQLLE